MTYAYQAAGCLLGVGTPEADKEAKELFDSLPGLKKDMGGREPPAEIYIGRKSAF